MNIGIYVARTVTNQLGILALIRSLHVVLLLVWLIGGARGEGWGSMDRDRSNQVANSLLTNVRYLKSYPSSANTSPVEPDFPVRLPDISLE